MKKIKNYNTFLNENEEYSDLFFNWEEEFLTKYNLSKEDLDRTYLVDSFETSLKNLLDVNARALMTTIMKLEEVFPVKEIIALEPGETYNTGGASNVDTKRIT